VKGVKKICIVGPESTGKTTLARDLARQYNTVFVPEFAREYAYFHGKIRYSDVMKIVLAQTTLERQQVLLANRILFCDTCPLSTFVYSRHYFRKAPKKLYQMICKERYHLYMLMDADLPWQKDSVRDSKETQSRLWPKFYHELKARNLPMVVITGYGESRIRNAIHAVNQFVINQSHAPWNYR
jgi:NadR type nicotinamide-nucleotide adenylyltransferase